MKKLRVTVNQKVYEVLVEVLEDDEQYVPGANMTGIAKRLEKSGFIARKSDPLDERVTILKLTPRGKTTLASIEKELDNNTHAMLKGLTAQEKIELLDKVKRLIKNSREIA